MKKILSILLILSSSIPFTFGQTGNSAVMRKPDGEIFQDLKFTSAHPFQFNGVTIGVASSTSTGFLTNGDWANFDSKEPGIPGGSASQFITGTKVIGSFNVSNGVTVTAVTGGVSFGLGTITGATWHGNAIADAYISSASIWNGKENVLSFASPLLRTSNLITIAQASGVTSGYLSNTDWTTFNNKASLASPAFTGTPLSTTAAVDTNTTQIATTAFVLGQAGSSNPIIDGTAAPGTSLRYARQDHVHPTDTSRAQDSLVVHLAGTETITGAKNFSGILTALANATITAATNPILRLNTTSANAAARHWAIGSNDQAFGDFTIRQGTSLGSDPAAGTVMLSITSSAVNIPGNLTVGGTFNPADFDIGIAGSYSPNVVFEGDSLTQQLGGYNTLMTGVNGPNPDFEGHNSAFAAAVLGTYNGIAVSPATGQNVAVAGYTVQNMRDNPGRIQSVFRRESGMNIAVVLAGTNTLTTKTAAQTYSEIEAYCRHLRNTGWRIVLVGLISRGGSNANGTYDSQIASVNALLRQNWAQLADRFVDWGVINSGSNEFAAGGYSNTTWYETDQLHPTYAGARKMAQYISPVGTSLLSGYMVTYRNQFVTSLNKASHTNVATDGMLTLHNENPVAGQSEINFTFYNGSTDALKANIRADYNGTLNFGAKGYIADYIDPTYGPDAYGDGTHFPSIIFYRDTNSVVSNRPFRVSTNSASGGFSGPGLDFNYSTSLDYAIVTAYNYTTNAWKPILIQGSSTKWATNGTDRMLLQGGLNIGGASDPGDGALWVGGNNNSNVTIQATGASSTSLRMLTYNDNSNNRNWAFRVRYSDNGSMELDRSTTSTGDPTTIAVFWHRSGGMALGGGTADAGNGNLMLSSTSAKGGRLLFGNDFSRFVEHITISGTEYYSFNAGATIIADSFTVRSSRDVKQNIRDWQPTAGDRKRLRPRLFERRATPGVDELGFVADEVSKVMPEAATSTGISVMALIAKHEHDIQAMQDRLDAVTPAPWWLAQHADPVSPPLAR